VVNLWPFKNKQKSAINESFGKNLYHHNRISTITTFLDHVVGYTCMCIINKAQCHADMGSGDITPPLLTLEIDGGEY
jgi:hypothetical protein